MIKVKVKDEMSSPVETIAVENHTIQDAAILMLRKNIGSLIVIDPVNDPSMITERDVVKAVAEGNFESPLIDYVISPLVTINENASLGDAAQLMLTQHIRRLAVLDNNGKISGIINMRDITTAVHDAFLAIFELA